MRDHTIGSAAAEIRAGGLNIRQLVEVCLARIERCEPRVRAWVLVDSEGALREADRLAGELRSGHDRGPLHGVPVGIKDIVDVAGCPTRAGSPLRAEHLASADATLVARLREAGAIILGKTVTTEFAFLDPSPTRNPWKLDHTPGGSSSGSAAAVAAGMCLAAIGSQTGGSITRPAAFCGVCGAKPSFGRVSRAGMVPLSFHLDHPGPLARSVTDLAIVLAAISGGDVRDPYSCTEPAPDYLSRINGPGPVRLGFFDQYFSERASDDVRAAAEHAYEGLRTAGARVEPITLPEDFDQFAPLHRRVMAVEAAEFHRPQFDRHADQFGPHIRALVEEGLATSAADYAAALRHRQAFRRKMQGLLADVVAVLTPAAPTSAPPSLETTGDPSFNSPWSYTGLPTVAIPCGLTRDGLPGAIQFIGRVRDEAGLLAAAAWCERALAFDRRPPIWTDG